MGRDKALVRFGGVPLAEHAARLLARVCATVLVADRGRDLIPDFRSIPDGPGAGPAAGLLGAAARHPGSDLLALACDLPQVTPALLARLAAPSAVDALVPRWRRGVEPLVACYRPRALQALAEEAEAGRFALHSLFELERLRVDYLEAAELEACGRPEELFRNLNRPRDLALRRRSPRG